MIVYDLQCLSGGHKFEAWFRSSGDFEDQRLKALIACPQCGCADVSKAAQAPRLGRKGNQMVPSSGREGGRQPGEQPANPASQQPSARQIAAALHHIATVQAEALKSSRDVGAHFAREARAMHYGEQDAEPIHGQATLAEARDLIEEGVELEPLLIADPAGKAN